MMRKNLARLHLVWFGELIMVKSDRYLVTLRLSDWYFRSFTWLHKSMLRGSPDPFPEFRWWGQAMLVYVCYAQTYTLDT